jgi:S1 RNA binding domain
MSNQQQRDAISESSGAHSGSSRTTGLWDAARALRAPKSFAAYVRALERERPVRGRVIDASGAGVGLALPPGLRGFVRRKDLPRSARRHPARLVGTEIEGLVVSVQKDAPIDRKILVSPRQLGGRRCMAAAGSRRRVTGRVVGVNRGGLILEIAGLQGFLPRPEMTPHRFADLEPMVGKTRRCYVIKASMQEVILSDFTPRTRGRRAAFTDPRQTKQASVRRKAPLRGAAFSPGPSQDDGCPDARASRKSGESHKPIRMTTTGSATDHAAPAEGR